MFLQLSVILFTGEGEECVTKEACVVKRACMAVGLCMVGGVGVQGKGGHV